MESNRIFMSKQDKKTSVNKHSDPLDTIIDFAWAAGADRFWVNNAKDELKKLRLKIEEYEYGSNRAYQEMDQKTIISRS